MKQLLFSSGVLCLVAMAAPVTPAEASKALAPLRTVSHVDLERYTGIR